MMEDVILSPIKKSELLNMIEAAVQKAVTGAEHQKTTLSDELINRQELKEYTGIASDVTVMKLEKLGVFKPIRLGRRLFYKKSEVNASLNKMQRA